MSDSYKTFGNLISRLEVVLDKEIDEDATKHNQLADIWKEVDNEVLNYKKQLATEYETMRKNEEENKLKNEQAAKDKESECI